MNRRYLNCLKLDKEHYTNSIKEIENLIASMFEHTETPDEAKINKLNGYVDKYKKRLEATEAQLKAFDEKLHGIKDPELKAMAKAYYIEWQSCEEIGRKYYLDRTTVYKKLMCYFGE